VEGGVRKWESFNYGIWIWDSYLTQFISHRLAGENLKASTITARTCLMVQTGLIPVAYELKI
jgi:hypothetical protein